MKHDLKTHLTALDDALMDIASAECGLDCSNLPDLTKQEFKLQSDPNWILKRFGALPPVAGSSIQEVDFDLNLQGALEAVRAVKDAFFTLPVEVRRAFPSPVLVAEALADGRLVFSKAAGTLEVPSSDPAGSPSDSAAGSAS